MKGVEAPREEGGPQPLPQSARNLASSTVRWPVQLVRYGDPSSEAEERGSPVFLATHAQSGPSAGLSLGGVRQGAADFFCAYRGF